jgi:hypothetical protein
MANSSSPLFFFGGIETNAGSGIAGTGTALSGATPLPGGVNVLNSATGNTAYTLPAGAGNGVYVVVEVLSGSTASALIFPATSTNQIYYGSLAAGASMTVAAGKSAVYISMGSGNWVGVLSA